MTWVDLVRQRAIERPDACAYTFLSPRPASGGAGEQAPIEQSLTFARLDEEARRIAAWLQARGAASGARALLLFPPGLDYVTAFFGCLYAGVVAVPAYPPDRTRLARTLPRIKAIAADAKATLVLTTRAILDAGDLESARADLEGTTWWTTDDARSAAAEAWSDPGLTPATVALLQYSSGSTSTPSGVILTHANMLHNGAVQQRAWNLRTDSVGVSWLPLYHDLGVISCLLQPVFTGFRMVMMSPVDFIQKPLRWLQAISRYRGTFAGGPNFAFDLCAQKIKPEERAALDLRSWETAFNGAEPIRPESLDRFAETFASSGFTPSALYPCYGLAEANFVSGMRPGAGATVGRFQASGLEKGEAIAAPVGDAGKHRSIVSCGELPEDQTLVIVDPQSGEPCAAGRVGEVWLSGGSVGLGYWGRPEVSEATFGARVKAFGDARFLRTGDLGFTHDGHLYLTGRLKDLIIQRGANHYPQDIELVVERSHPAMRAGCAAAFALEQDGGERVVVVQEVVDAEGSDLTRALENARVAVLREHEIALYAVVLVKPGSIAKTTSGKIQRRASKTAFLEGTLDVVAEWRQGAVTPTAPAPQAMIEADGGKKRSAQAIEEWLVANLSRQLSRDPRHIDVREPFASYGLDSLAATELTGALETWLERRVEPTAVYEQPTIEALARHLATGRALPSWAPPKRGKMERAPADEPIAIVGIGCRFPGGDSPEAFWSLLSEGIDAVTEVPEGRWDAAKVFDPDPSKAGKTNSRWGGFLSQVDHFDSLFFGISPREARHMDPQQRLLLELAWEALEDAGAIPDALRGSATGVFLGMTTEDYGHMQWNRPAAIDMYSATGTLSSVAAGRISYVFDFRGPCLSIDTACSSSLVAIHQACQSLWSFESTLALAGGVNLMLTPENGISQTRLGALSADGRCKAFDDRADGFVRGEGAGLVVLKRLSEAVADGDRIYAVVRGSATNQDGRSNGLTAPNPQAQRAVLRAAYRHAGVSPGAVGYIEAHGTGTPLGDPMELQAIGRVLATDRAAGDLCAVGSVKTNIGHLESAAGVAGLIKASLALHHEALPASLHFKRGNPLIPFDKIPVRVQAEMSPWPRSSKPRVAGVSAFGIGGTNAHVVLAEAPADERAVSPEPSRYVLPLSGRTPEARAGMARAYAVALSAGSLADVSLADVCYTASVRRAHFEHRLCVVAGDRREMVARLLSFERGEPADGVWVNGDDSRARAAGETDEDAIARRYVAGEENFASLQGAPRRVVTLPSYAWQRTRHWLAEVAAPATVVAEGEGKHPLLERHLESASGELLWQVDVTPASHGFIRDHVLGGVQVFPGLAYVEMALAGASSALGEGPFAAADIELLLAMVIDDDGRTVQLALSPDARDGSAEFKIHSRPRKKTGGANEWTLHARGRVEPETNAAPAPGRPDVDLADGDRVAGDDFYARLRETGTGYGPRFRGVEAIRRQGAVAVGDVSLPVALSREASPYLFHPALLDACAQVLLATQTSMHPFMPVRIGRIRLLGKPRGLLEAHARITSPNADEAASFQGDVRIYEEDALVAEILDAEVQLLDRMLRPRAAASPVFELAWSKDPRPLVRHDPRGTWLLIPDRQGIAAAVAEELASRGGRAEEIPFGPSVAEDVRARLLAATANGETVEGVVHLSALDLTSLDPARPTASELEAANARGCALLAPLARELLATKGGPRLWSVTRGAQGLSGDAGDLDAAAATLWGFARTLAVECAPVWGGVIDLDSLVFSASEDARAIVSALGSLGEDQVAVRDGVTYVPRIVRRELPASPAPFECRGGGAYLVTGGLGGLGLLVAKRLVERGARELLLWGRKALPAREEWGTTSLDADTAARVAAVRELEGAGARVHLAACDVSRTEDVRQALASFGRASQTPIRGVVHAAGVGRLRALAQMGSADFDADFQPKAVGASVLDQMLDEAPLDFFLLYSSLSAVLPSPRMAGYAASNAFLEALARNRRARGKPALCIHWGMWGEAGMAARAMAGSDADTRKNPRRRDWKATSLATTEALDVQEQLLQAGASVAIVTRSDWSEMAKDPLLGSMPLLSSVCGARAPTPVAVPEVPAVTRKIDAAALAALAHDARLATLTTYLSSALEEVLALDAGALDVTQPLDTVGYDSLAAVDLQLRLTNELALEVPLLALLQRGSARDVAERIAKQLVPEAAAPPTAPARVAPLRSPPRAPLASTARTFAPNEINATLSLYPARTPTLPPATHTNSYALGGRDVILVEPATPFESEQRAWIEWARGLASSGRRPVALFATHHHDDHVGGLEVLSRELDLPVWMHRETWARIGGEEPARFLEDGETLHLDGPIPEAWRVLHTPGHAPGHVCLWNPDSRALIAGDMIASVGSILIAPGDGDMQSYLEQLQRLMNLGADVALPAHGPPVRSPNAMFRQYILDHQSREQDVLRAVLQAGTKGGTTEKLVGVAYGDAPPHTWSIGILGLRSHLEKLRREGRVEERDGSYRACG